MRVLYSIKITLESYYHREMRNIKVHIFSYGPHYVYEYRTKYDLFPLRYPAPLMWNETLLNVVLSKDFNQNPGPSPSQTLD